MQITIYNTNDRTEQNELDQRIGELSEILGKNHEVSTVVLKDLDLKYCTGCWSCWVKTPGICMIQDDISLILHSFIHSDLVIFAGRMIMGFPSALMKKVNDRLVPLVHPYIELVNDECHHVARYTKYPSWGMLLEEEDESEESDIQIVKEIYERTALNIKSRLLFTCTTSQTAKEIAHEIDHI